MDDKEKLAEVIPNLKQAPRRTARQVTVSTVRVTGEGALVEFAQKGNARRVTIPTSEVRGGKVAQDVLDAGIPYGLPWENVTLVEVTASALAANLRKVGIWTAEDLRRNTQRAIGALQATYHVDLAALLRFATEQSKGE